MKINKATKAAMAAKQTTHKAKTAKVKAAKKAVVEVRVTGMAIALLTGKRSAGNGGAARLVQTGKQGELTVIRATQRNDGLSLTDAVWCPVIGGFLSGTRQAQLELGGYVNNGKYGGKGVKVQLMTTAQFRAASRPAKIKWNIDKQAVIGRAIGDASQTGLLAVETNGFYWQIEQDANPANAHERGTVVFTK